MSETMQTNQNQTQVNQGQTNQVNQQAQTQPLNNNVVFDVNNLPPEFQRYVDQQRTQASQTARNNARKELMGDESFLDEIRNRMKPQVEQTVEQQLEQLRRETYIDRSTAKVERVLAKAGLSEEDMAIYMPMLVSEDVDASIQAAENFVSAFNKTVENRIAQQTKKAMQNMDTPTVNNNTISEQQRLQAAYDAAKKDTSYRKFATMSAITREAAEKGIVLK